MKTTITIIIGILILAIVNEGAKEQETASELKPGNPSRENGAISFKAPEKGAGAIRIQLETGQ